MLRLIEGWDYFPDNPNTQMLQAMGWSSGLSALRTSGSDPAFGYGKYMIWSGLDNANTTYRYARGRYTDWCFWGMRMMVPTSGDGYYIGAWDTHSTRETQWRCRFDQFGCIYLYTYNGGNATLLAKTLPDTFSAGRWFWLEIGWKPGYTDGAIEIRVNTVPQLVLNNIRLSDGSLILPATLPGFTNFSYNINRGQSGWSNDWRIDDTYLNDNTGSINNSFLGNVRAKYMALVGDASPIQWTIGGSSPAATNWQSASNPNMNDTSYVYTSTIGHQDLYSIDPNLNTPLVHGLEVCGAYRQDDATQRFVENAIESNGVLVTGDTWAINQSYTFYYDVYELNPDTGLQFTGAEANAVNVGPLLVV